MGTEEEVVKVDEWVVGVKEVVKARWRKTASTVISSLHGLAWWKQVQATLLRVTICCWNTATPDSTHVSTVVTHHRDQQVHYHDINT